MFALLVFNPGYPHVLLSLGCRMNGRSFNRVALKIAKLSSSGSLSFVNVGE